MATPTNYVVGEYQQAKAPPDQINIIGGNIMPNTVIDNLIVGGGPGGLYTAWRLANEKASGSGKVTGDIRVYEWGNRLGGRIYTKHFDTGQFIELGGMRFSEGHKLVNKTIDELGIRDQVVDFNMVQDRLYFLRGVNVYDSEIPTKGVPYNTPDNTKSSDDLFAQISDAATGGNAPNTRRGWCEFFDNARLPSTFDSQVYNPGDLIGNIGYWNLMFDQLGSEGFQYAADAGGYTSNVINWNAANAIPYNGEFGADYKYLRLKNGYSTLINALQAEATNKGVVIQRGMCLETFEWDPANSVFVCTFQSYSAGEPSGNKTIVKAKKLFLCMPRNSIELIANNSGDDHILKNRDVKYYVESVIEQPSYKIALLFDTAWWEQSDYPPKLNYTVDGQPVTGFGPTVTDLPLRQIYYFGNNAPANRPVAYGLLASYDDMWYTQFWQAMETNITQRETSADSDNLQPLSEGSPASGEMIRMLRHQLAQVHFSDGDISHVPQPIQALFMDWGRNPYYAGYHAWKAHYSLKDSMQKVRAPYKIVNQNDHTPLYIMGSAYSNDQAWIEGAFCTADSVLRDFFNITPIVNDPTYPLISGD
ncbi:flavin monoamine oxidase family protein [Mesorhizobium sp. SP-1A]|uniref:flavin monoamine oxidase family protein n=1 Tax=Mesorhizobium sp. SP-1A TaxID=3077840 RepID=UPI0028F71056|nr:FAD-dependent oxidoreductase [Mesorhizobium sp. SP-1A]